MYFDYKYQLELIGLLQDKLRGPLLDLFFKGYNYIDTPWFLLALIGFIYSFKSRKEGLKLAFIFLLSGFINSFLKDYFHQPRPCQMEPHLGLICYKTYGLPSGAAQTATLILVIGFNKIKKTSLKVLTAIFCFLLYVSRIYLGQHFFTDILGGMVTGGALSIYYLYLLDLSAKQLGIVSLMTGLLIMGLFHSPSWNAGPVFLGLALSLLLIKEPRLFAKQQDRFISYLAQVIGTFCILLLVPFFPIGAGILASFWFTGGHLLALKSLFKSQTQ